MSQMAHTDHSRRRRAGEAPRHIPRPAPRRTGTRIAVVAAAVKEG